MTGVISAELTLAYGRNTIDFINGIVTNQSVSPPTVTRFDPPGSKYYMDKIRSLYMYVESDVTVEFSGASVEFDMMSFNKIMRNIEIETMDVLVDTTYVPNQVKVIFVASDDPLFVFSPTNTRPHMFYANRVTAPGDNSYQDLFKRHTVGEKFKCQVFNDNGGANAITVDIQHRELAEGSSAPESYDDWVSYYNFPQVLAAGNVLSFGDDALRDPQHHFHRVRVKTNTASQTSTVDGAMLNI